jgi:hypothetical protein
MEKPKKLIKLKKSLHQADNYKHIMIENFDVRTIKFPYGNKCSEYYSDDRILFREYHINNEEYYVNYSLTHEDYEFLIEEFDLDLPPKFNKFSVKKNVDDILTMHEIFCDRFSYKALENDRHLVAYNFNNNVMNTIVTDKKLDENVNRLEFVIDYNNIHDIVLLEIDYVSNIILKIRFNDDHDIVNLFKQLVSKIMYIVANNTNKQLYSYHITKLNKQLNNKILDYDLINNLSNKYLAN